MKSERPFSVMQPTLLSQYCNLRHYSLYLTPSSRMFHLHTIATPQPSVPPLRHPSPCSFPICVLSTL